MAEFYAVRVIRVPKSPGPETAFIWETVWSLQLLTSPVTHFGTKC